MSRLSPDELALIRSACARSSHALKAANLALAISEMTPPERAQMLRLIAGAVERGDDIGRLVLPNAAPMPRKPAPKAFAVTMKSAADCIADARKQGISASRADQTKLTA